MISFAKIRGMPRLYETPNNSPISSNSPIFIESRKDLRSTRWQHDQWMNAHLPYSTIKRSVACLPP